MFLNEFIYFSAGGMKTVPSVRRHLYRLVAHYCLPGASMN